MTDRNDAPLEPARTSAPLEPGRTSAPLVHISVIVAVGMLLLVGTVGLYLWSNRPRLSHTEVRDLVYSTIQRESPESFLVTGSIEVTATTRVANTRTLLPGIVDLDLGTTSATVRVPGRVSYGFDLRELTPEMIRIAGDTLIEVAVPEPVIYSVEPNLEQMEVETQRGWARMSTRTAEAVRDRAVGLVQRTLRAQGEAHLRNSAQPRINTADALYHMLRPVLVAAGISEPQLRFRIGRMTIEPGEGTGADR
ncbi:MAG TPA: DUF4230 domain-containing protein [Longimicrobiales bacterium]